MMTNIDVCKVHDVLGTEQEDLKDIPGKLRSILLLLPKDEVYQEKLQEFFK